MSILDKIIQSTPKDKKRKQQLNFFFFLVKFDKVVRESSWSVSVARANHPVDHKDPKVMQLTKRPV